MRIWLVKRPVGVQNPGYMIVKNAQGEADPWEEQISYGDESQATFFTSREQAEDYLACYTPRVGTIEALNVEG